MAGPPRKAPESHGPLTHRRAHEAHQRASRRPPRRRPGGSCGVDQDPRPWGGSEWVTMGGSTCPPSGGSAWALLVDHLPRPATPVPLPCGFVRSLPDSSVSLKRAQVVKKGSNMCSRTAGSIPEPVSVTVRHALRTPRGAPRRPASSSFYHNHASVPAGVGGPAPFAGGPLSLE